MEKIAILKTVFVTSMVLAVLVGAASAQVGNPGITIDVTPIEDEVCPTGTAIYNVSVHSTETGYVNFTIEPERTGWTYAFNPEGFDIGPGETKYSILSIGVPSNATPSDYSHNITADEWIEIEPGVFMWVGSSPYNNLETTVTPGIPTYASVIVINEEPKVQYKWETPDDTPGDGYTNVYPIPGDNVTVDKYVVVCDPNGEGDITEVVVRTFYPLDNGSACNCTPCNESNCCEPDDCVLKEESVATALDNRTACDDAVEAAYVDGLLTADEKADIMEFLDNGTAWIYIEHNNFNCSDHAGNYTVCAQVFDTEGEYDCIANTFKYESIISLAIDFSEVEYGDVTPSVTKWAEPGNVKNDGNDPMDILIEAWNMTNSTSGGVIPADKLDAAILVDPLVHYWFKLPPESVLFNVSLPGCVYTPINFSIHVPTDTQAGDYTGCIRMTGKTVKHSS